MAYPLTVPSPECALVLAHARLGHADEIAELLTTSSTHQHEDEGPCHHILTCAGVFGTPLVEACRARAYSPLHVLTVQTLIQHTVSAANAAEWSGPRPSLDAVDWYGATALIHAALRCSVLEEAHLVHRIPAPGIDTHAVQARGAAARHGSKRIGTAGRRSGDAGTMHERTNVDAVKESKESARLPVTPVKVHPTDSAELMDMAVPFSPIGVQPLARPREFSAEDLTRHIQVITMLLNARANVHVRTRNGVNAAMLLAASPSAAACSVLEWVLETMTGAGAARTNGATEAIDGLSHPSLLQVDTAGATILHYAAYAANTFALKALMRMLDGGLMRQLSRTEDTFGRTPSDVLALVLAHEFESDDHADAERPHIDIEISKGEAKAFERSASPAAAAAKSPTAAGALAQGKRGSAPPTTVSMLARGATALAKGARMLNRSASKPDASYKQLAAKQVKPPLRRSSTGMQKPAPPVEVPADIRRREFRTLLSLL